MCHRKRCLCVLADRPRDLAWCGDHVRLDAPLPILVSALKRFLGCHLKLQKLNFYRTASSDCKFSLIELSIRLNLGVLSQLISNQFVKNLLTLRSNSHETRKV
jgi:hypothetical protein